MNGFSTYCISVTFKHCSKGLGLQTHDADIYVYADSCQDVLIENCYISVGDDAIAVKSGWDQYGIAYGRPSSNISIRNVTARSLVR